MRKDKIVLDREIYDKLCELKDRKYDYYIEQYEQYQARYYKEVDENKKLQNENGYLKALFDKEGDTQVIKYNGKLYKIVSATNYIEGGVEETLDVSLVPVSEVG